jgi:hypothetical protein
VPSAAAPPTATATAAHLAVARRTLGLRLAGVSTWRPPAATVNDLRSVLAFRDARPAAALLADSAVADLVDFEAPDAAAAGGGPDFPAAAAALAAALAEDRCSGRASPESRRAHADYAAAVQRDLVGPLRGWAMAATTPVGRAAAAEVAAACEVLHGMSPLVTELISRAYDPAAGRLAAPADERLMDQFLRVLGRVTAIGKDVDKWHHR